MSIKMEKVILTDADGCLLDWSKAFDRYMHRQGYVRVPDTDDQYSLGRRFGISEHESYKLAKRFNESRHIKYIEPYKDAVEYVKKLHNKGFMFIVVSSLSDHTNAKAYRFENLKEVFGDGIFQNNHLHCLATGIDKQDTLERWGDTGYFWIEDHFKNAEAGHEVGLRPILIDSPYNRHYQTDLFPRVDEHNPWRDIYEIITNGI